MQLLAVTLQTLASIESRHKVHAQLDAWAGNACKGPQHGPQRPLADQAGYALHKCVVVHKSGGWYRQVIKAAENEGENSRVHTYIDIEVNLSHIDKVMYV